MKTLYCNLCSILAAGKNARKLKNLSFLNLQTNKLQAEVEKITLVGISVHLINFFQKELHFIQCSIFVLFYAMNEVKIQCLERG